MKHLEIIHTLKNKTYAPVYFLCGEETYFIDIIEKYIEDNVLDPGTRDFNLSIFYGKDAEPSEIINTCMRLPNFAERQLVILREAQQLKSYDLLEKYIEKPVNSTILVISHKYKTPDKRTAFGKNIQKKSVYFEAVKIKDSELPSWIMDACKQMNMKIIPAHAQLISEYLGNDLSRIHNELQKLRLIAENSTITEQHIEQQIGISKEYNSFELSKAFETGNKAKALQIIDYFSKNPKAGPIQMVIATLYNYFSRLFCVEKMAGMSDGEIASAAGIPPFAVKNYRSALSIYNAMRIHNALHIIALYDRKSKGIDNSADDAALMQEMVFKIMQ
jgi:DNA polymerase-3 subunit delta